MALSRLICHVSGKLRQKGIGSLVGSEDNVGPLYDSNIFTSNKKRLNSYRRSIKEGYNPNNRTP